MDPSHYQGLLELRQGRQQEQQQQNEEEEEEQPFVMELVSTCFLYITPLCSYAATRLCSLCCKSFQDREQERECGSCFHLASNPEIYLFYWRIIVNLVS